MSREWPGVKHDGGGGVLSLAPGQDGRLSFTAQGAVSPLLSVPLTSLLENKIFTKKRSTQVRILTDKGEDFQLEFPKRDELQSFLTAFASALSEIETKKSLSSPSTATKSAVILSPPEAKKVENSPKPNEDAERKKPLSEKLVDQPPKIESSIRSPPVSVPVGEKKPYLTANVIGHVKVATDAAAADPYVVYVIRTQSNVPTYRSEKKNDNNDSEWLTHHRFRDFEMFRDELVRNHQEAHVPELPQKTYLNRFNSVFLDDRTAQLNKFIEIVAANPKLRDSKELHSFLTHDPHINAVSLDAAVNAGSQEGQEASGTSPGSGWERYFVDNRLTTALENVVIHAWSGARGSGSNEPVFDTQMDQDYFNVQQIAKKWELAPSKLPFQKFVVLALGTTSAGKSSFINHYFGVSVKKEADAQQDTVFTIVEVVSSHVFDRYSGSKLLKSDIPPAYPKFSAEDLAKNVTDVAMDPRYGFVFIELDSASTLARYSTQLGQIADQVKKFNLFNTILINEHYLSPQAPNRALALKSIVIDSPGFNSETANGQDLLDRFIGNLRILQALYSLADETLFFIPATHLNMVSNQLQILELSLLYSVVGAEQMEKLILSAARRDDDKLKSGGLFAGLMKGIKNALSSADEIVYKGTSIWEKTIFVLSKIDLLQSNEDTMRHVFYELGGLFSKSFAYLPNPVADSIVSISLPGRSQVKVNSQLQSLHEKLKAKAAQQPYEKRIEVAIQSLCDQVRKAVTSSWSKYYSSDSKEAERIYARSVQRLQNLSK